MDEFLVVLNNLLSHDNEIRRTAETAYTRLRESQPALTLSNLAKAVSSPQMPPHLRSLAAVLLRQIIKSDWQNIDSATKDQLHELLLKTLEAEDNIQLCRKISYAIISEPSASLEARRNLVPRVHEALRNTPKDKKKLTFVRILDLIAEFSISSIVNDGYEKTIQILQASLQNSSQTSLQLAAASALISLTLSLSDSRQKLETLISSDVPIIMSAIGKGLLMEGRGFDEAVRTLEALCSLSSKCIWAFEHSLPVICDQLMDIASSNQVKDSGKCLSLELFNELLHKRSKTITQNTSFLEKCLSILMKLQCEDEEWMVEWDENRQANSNDLLQMNEPGTRGSALVTLSCLSSHLSDPKTFLNLLFGLVTRALASSIWQEQYAGLSTLAVTFQPQGSTLEPVLGQIVSKIEPFICTTHPALQYIACASIYELLASNNLKRHIQRQYHSTLLPALSGILTGNAAPLVKSSACSTISLFMESLEDVDDDTLRDTIIANYVDQLVHSLITCMQKGSLSLQEDAMLALSNVAALSGEGFAKYYGQLLPGMKSLLSQQANDSSKVELKIACMSCLASMAEAIGKEKFAVDAVEIMQILLKDCVGSDLNELDGLFDFSKRICAVLKGDFIPFLPHILPAIFQAVDVDINVRLEDVVDEDASTAGVSTNNGDMTIIQNIRGKGTFRVSANIYAYQIRINALDALDSIADTLGSSFAPYIDESLRVVIPAIKDKLNIQASITASEASASLLHSAVRAVVQNRQNPEPLVRLLVSILSPLLVALETASQPRNLGDEQDISNDTTPEQRAGYAGGIERCLRICWYSGGDENNPDGTRPEPILRPPMDLVKSITTVLRDAVSRSTERRFLAAQGLAAQGYEGEDIEEIIEELCEEEDLLMTDLIDSIGYLIKLFRTDYLPVFQDTVHPLISRLLQVDKYESLNANAVCLYDDVIQYCGKGSHKYLPLCFPVMAQYMKSSNVLLRQASVYGMGQVAEHAPEFFVRYANDVVITLLELTQEPDARSREKLDATENVVSVIGKICYLYPQHVDTAQLLPFWLQNLPIKSDEEEAQYSHELLCKLVELRNEHLLGQKENQTFKQNIVKIINVFADALSSDKELLSQVTKEKIPKVINSLRAITGEADFQGLCSTLEIKKQETLRHNLI